MALLEDPILRNRYQKYKYRVKVWESEFMEKLGRQPNKTDIKQADIKIKQAYKVYWDLKTRALEDSLTEISFSDTTLHPDDSILKDSNNATFNETSLSTFNENTNDSILSSTILHDSTSTSFSELTDCKSEIENVPDSSNVDLHNVKNVWNKSLNLKNKDDSGKRLVGRSSSFQLSQKMFKSSNFITRNPRKSLSANKIPKKNVEKVVLEKEEKIEGEGERKEGEREDESMNEKDISNEFLEAMVDSSIKFKTVENRESQPVVSGIQQIISGQKNLRTVDAGWLKRCSTDVRDIKTALPVSKPTSHVSDEEDFIYNSDTEEDHRRKRVRNFRRHYTEGSFPEAKRFCPGNFSDNTSDPLPPTLLNAITNTNVQKANCDQTNNVPAIANMTTMTEMKSTVPAMKATTLEVGKPDVQTTLKAAEISSMDHSDKKENVRKEDVSLAASKPSDLDRKRRMTRKSKSADDSESWESSDGSNFSDEEVKPKRRAVAGRKSQKKEKAPRKTRATTGTTRKTTAKATKKTAVQSDSEPEEQTNVQQDVFDVDNVNAVARFALTPVSTGSLVEDFSRVLESRESANKSSQKSAPKPKGKLTDKEKLEKRVANGTLNENFVRINLKKKVFVRGKKNFNYAKYKKNQWKQRKKELATSEANMEALDFIDKKGSGASYCFKCNEAGHFSKYCPNMKVDTLIPHEESEDLQIPSEFPTLEEAAEMARISSARNFSRSAPRNVAGAANVEEGIEDWGEWDDEWEDEIEGESQMVKEMCKVPEELVEKLLPKEKNAVPPIYPLEPDGSIPDTPLEVYSVLKKFGHDSFRPGQEQAIMRILSGVSTLVTLATGTGKSLCYQLPAYIFAQRSNCITLVVSPLVSLMDDQVKGIPHMLKAACLHTNQTEKVRQEVISSVRKGNINVLLVSPEAVVAGERSSGLGAIIKDLPPIAFACIDEAHCISQWSHNFRPSYLMLCRVLKEKLKVKVLLGLTATATKSNATSIVEHLGIPDGIGGVITDRPLPDNLHLTVSRDSDRDQALMELLQSERLRDCQSILIYCTRREECVRIAALLRTVLEDRTRIVPRGKKRISPVAEAYHAGFSASQRKSVQKAFMNGDTRIIVATVAFGMGINKSDIRCVIHYNMPSNFENYVQEIGRAGRDGLPAQCHLFLNTHEEYDKMELRRHIFANSVDRSTIRKLLGKLFVPCSCLSSLQKSCGQRCAGHEVALPANETVESLDTNEEIISTLLCYLELHENNYITVLSNAYTKATVSTYGGSRALKLAAQNSPPLAMAIAIGMKNKTYKENDASIDFDVIDIASNIGWDSGIVKSHLKGLEWLTVDGVTKRSQISVKFHTLGLRVRAPGDLSDSELDEALNTLYHRSKSQETSRLAQLNSICEIVRSYSVPTVKHCSVIDEQILEKSNNFKQEIRKYFVEDDKLLDSPTENKPLPVNESQIVQDVRGLMSTYRDTNFTGRAVARIFYGIQSPNYPARIWCRCRYWRAYMNVDFNRLCQIATRELLSAR